MAERNRRIKKLNFCQLKSVKIGENEQMMPGNRSMEGVFVVVLAAEFVKNFYFSYRSTDLTTRLLFGDIIISHGKDQRLFNLMLSVAYLCLILQFYFGRFHGQKVRFYQLSRFLLVEQHEAYARRYFVARQFVLKFTKEMDFLANLCPLLVNGFVKLQTVFFKLINLTIPLLL